MEINLMNLAKYAIATCLISSLLPAGLLSVSANPIDRVASTSQKSVTQPVDPALQTALQTAIASYMRAEKVPATPEQRFLADYIDLNGDGALDALVVFNSSYWCGTGGCMMLVFQGQKDKTFRLVSSSSLIRTPLTVSTTKTNLWRDLIVDVRGGGATPEKVALKFDGKGYPFNPSIQPSLPLKTAIAGTVLFPEGSEPQTFTETATQKTSSQAAKPSFDCTKARGAVESLICKDNELANLDRYLDGVYQAALKKAEEFPPKELANFKAEQIGWIKGRNDCWKAQGTLVRNCVKQNFLDRTAELQAVFALVPSKKPVFYTCNNNPANEIVSTFYQTNPLTARLERGDTTLIAFLRPSGSGAKYEGQNVTFWSKGKEALVEWKGEKIQCRTNLNPQS
jgi:uncharacterized protein